MATKTGLPTTREEVLSILINRKTPQAINTNIDVCTYLHSFNGGCAIGQCLTEAQAIKVEGDEGNISVHQAIQNKTLPERLGKLGKGFLENVQSVHDGKTYWNDYLTAKTDEQGLVWNNSGREVINEIIKEYKLDLPLLELI